jgi:hypothetical protein
MRRILNNHLTGACFKPRGIVLSPLFTVLAGCDGQQSALNPAGAGAQSIATLFWWMAGGAGDLGGGEGHRPVRDPGAPRKARDSQRPLTDPGWRHHLSGGRAGGAMSEKLSDEHQLTDQQAPEAPPEERDTLWLLTFSPTIWAVHFLSSYLTVSVWCAKAAGRVGELSNIRIAIGVFTLLALVGITLTGWRGWRQHTFGHATAPHDFDTPGNRHRFLGFSTLLLSGLSFVATIFVALCVVFIRSCA